jgi:hypothetical protein
MRLVVRAGSVVLRLQDFTREPVLDEMAVGVDWEADVPGPRALC